MSDGLATSEAYICSFITLVRNAYAALAMFPLLHALTGRCFAARVLERTFRAMGEDQLADDVYLVGSGKPVLARSRGFAKSGTCFRFLFGYGVEPSVSPTVHDVVCEETFRMRKPIFLDEMLDPELGRAFGVRAMIHTPEMLGILGKSDTDVINAAIARKCLIVTANDDFVAFYRSHPERRRGRFFYGLIHLEATGDFTRKRHLAKALGEMDWGGTRKHDDIIFIARDGSTRHERLCHPECSREFALLEGEDRD